MKVGTLTFEQAVKKLDDAHSIMCDQIGEFVSISELDGNLQIFPHSGIDDSYEFVKSQNETVEVCAASNNGYSFQYMRFYTEDGDEMDFVLFEPAPIITMDSLLHPE